MKLKKTILCSISLIAAGFAIAETTPPPAKVLLITGGCCHDYNAQKDIIKNGLEKRLNIEVTQIHSSDKSTKPPLPNHGNPDYAVGYDLIIHDECAADISDPEVIQGIINPHQNGIPGINLHCAMHSYRFGNFKKPVDPEAVNAAWFNYLGLQSFSHGPNEPISIRFSNANHPANAGLEDWNTDKEELYHVVQIMPKTTVLAHGTYFVNDTANTEKVEEHPIVWTHEYGPKNVRIWSTSLGHFNETVADGRYLDMLTNGVVWTLNRDDLRKKQP